MFYDRFDFEHAVWGGGCLSTSPHTAHFIRETFWEHPWNVSWRSMLYGMS